MDSCPLRVQEKAISEPMADHEEKMAGDVSSCTSDGHSNGCLPKILQESLVFLQAEGILSAWYQLSVAVA